MKVSLHENGKKLIITEWNRAFFLILSGIPVKSKWVDRALHFDAAGAAIAYLLQHFPDAEWDAGAAKKRDEYINVQITGKIGSDMKAIPTDGIQWGYDGVHTTPYAHQNKSGLLFHERDIFGLFYEQGCGKSKPTIDIAAWKYEHKLIDALLIVAPNNVHRNWIDNEVPTHLHPRIKRHLYLYLSGDSPRKAEAKLQAALSARARGEFLIAAFNIEGFVSDKAKAAVEAILSEYRCMTVVDESSRIRTPGAKRTKYVNGPVKDGSSVRVILSGTPVAKGVENLYSQLEFLDSNILGFNSFYTFRNHFCIMGGFEGKQIVGYKNVQEELIPKMDGYTHRVLKRDALDLPPKIYKRMPFDLTKDQRRVYDELRDTFMAEYKGQELTAAIAIQQITRLQQISSGWWPSEQLDEEGGKTTILTPFEGSNPRLDACKTILEDTEGKVIIWARFNADIDLLMRELGDEAVQYDGRVSERQRVENMKRWKGDPSCPYFVAKLQSAGIGLTLVEADTTIFYSNLYDLEMREQGEDRNHRIGTKRPVTYYDLEAVNTVDRKIVTSLRKKKTLAESVLGDPKGFFLQYEE